MCLLHVSAGERRSANRTFNWKNEEGIEPKAGQEPAEKPSLGAVEAPRPLAASAGMARGAGSDERTGMSEPVVHVSQHDGQAVRRPFTITAVPAPQLVSPALAAVAEGGYFFPALFACGQAALAEMGSAYPYWRRDVLNAAPADHAMALTMPHPEA